MNEVVNINGTDIQVKIWNGQKVVTFVDIDKVHKRADGTARKRFNDNKKHLIENEDYFKIKKSLLSENRTLGIEVPNRGITVLTESGYLLLVKSFTDDLAWNVQRQLVNSYFKFKEVMENLHPTENGLMLSETKFTEAIDTLTTCAAIFQNMMEYTTINYKQQQELLKQARERINFLLEGAHSAKYAKYSRIYFKNLWLNFAEHFQCGTYKDLNPLYMDSALEYISTWEYIED